MYKAQKARYRRSGNQMCCPCFHLEAVHLEGSRLSQAFILFGESGKVFGGLVSYFKFFPPLAFHAPLERRYGLEDRRIGEVCQERGSE